MYYLNIPVIKEQGSTDTEINGSLRVRAERENPVEWKREPSWPSKIYKEINGIACR